MEQEQNALNQQLEIKNMEQKELSQQIEKLKKQNKKLKRERIILGIYVVLSAIIYSYNNYFHQFFN